MTEVEMSEIGQLEIRAMVEEGWRSFLEVAHENPTEAIARIERFDKEMADLANRFFPVRAAEIKAIAD